MDLRSKLYHERKEGRAEGISQGLAMRNEELIHSLSKKGKSPEEIAELLDLDIQHIKNTIAK